MHWGIYSVDRDSNAVKREKPQPGWEKIRVQVDPGAVDTVTPKDTAAGISMKPSEASQKGIGFVAASGTRIENYGEKRVIGYTDDWHGISMNMQCADVKKTLGSAHRMNQNGNVAVLDGTSRFTVNKGTNKVTLIEYVNGQRSVDG